MWKTVLLLAPALALPAQDAGRLSLESLFHPQRKVSYADPLPSRYAWRVDGTLLEERTEKGAVTAINRIAPGSWETASLLDQAQFTAALTAAGASAAELPLALAGPLVWNPAQDAFVTRGGTDLFLVELASGKARRLATGDSPAFSPDGTLVAYLEGSDIRAVELATGKVYTVTTGGDATHLNGRLDWVYQEEVLNERGNFRGFWWSPDSRRIAYLALDESPVPVFTLMDDRTQPQKSLPTPYPKAGDPLPVARIGVAGLDGKTTWMEEPYPGQEVLVPRVGWDPAGRVVAHFTDRTQSWLDCRIFDDTGSRSLVTERSRAWVDHLPLPLFLRDGRFLWQSARSGFHHLYLYDAQGRLLGPVTQGDWDVRKVLGVDEAWNRVFFEATQRGAVGLDVFRAELTGQNSHMRRLTEAPGTHALTFNRTFTAAVDRFTDVDTPPQDLLLDSEGTVLQRIPGRASGAFKALRLGKVTFQQVRTRDGALLETMLVLPPGFDAARKYPVFHYVYGGPDAPLVKNAFSRSMLFFHFLAQQGIVTWVVDNRSAAAKGISAHGVHRNLGAQELQDQLDSLEWLRAQGWADMGRIALHGYSYGGFLAAYAMTHSKAWKLAVIGAPVTDWRLYDAVYTERYMGLPRDNPQGYEAASVLKAASRLSGRILLLHGTLDGNVHPQNSIQFIDALQKAGLNAPLILLPGSDHSPKAQHLWAMYAGMWDFLKAYL